MRKGLILVSTLNFSAIIFLITVIMLKMYYNGYIESLWLLQKREAFWLAEAGVAQAKVNLISNQNWYTDSAHYPKNDQKWLIDFAVGQTTQQGSGKIKVVHEERSGSFYSIGRRGQGLAIIKIGYQPQPFKVLDWQEL